MFILLLYFNVPEISSFSYECAKLWSTLIFYVQDYLLAGSDFVETNTFNGTAVSQSDYGTQHLVS